MSAGRPAWRLVASVLIAQAIGCAPPAHAPMQDEPTTPVQLGQRPFYLLDRLAPSPLRERLDACREGPFRTSRFSIGHRGAPLQFPEHTRESYLAAIRMGAGAAECDVTFTRDGEMVCRHAQCDLATTTNILETPLADRCRQGFQAATFDPETGALSRPASARCCASDLTLSEFRALEGRMDASDPRARTIAEFLNGTPRWRTDLYSNGATLMTHAESVELFRQHGLEMVPELKAFVAAPPLAGTENSAPVEKRERARRLVDGYRDAGIPPGDVALQSFDLEVIRIWLAIAPEFGARAIWLYDHAPSETAPSQSEFRALFEEGLRTIAPPIGALLRLDESDELRASDLARNARSAGLDIVAWTTERSGRIRQGRVEGSESDFYLGPIQAALENDGDVYRVIDALVHEVGVRAVFSDWPATTTYYANCFGLD